MACAVNVAQWHDKMAVTTTAARALILTTPTKKYQGEFVRGRLAIVPLGSFLVSPNPVNRNYQSELVECSTTQTTIVRCHLAINLAPRIRRPIASAQNSSRVSRLIAFRISSSRVRVNVTATRHVRR